MRFAGFLILAAAAPLLAQSPVPASSTDNGEAYAGQASLLHGLGIEIGMITASMRSMQGTPILDLPQGPSGQAGQSWAVHFAPSGSPAHAVLFRLTQRATGVAGEIGYSNNHAWSGFQYALRETRMYVMEANGVSLGGSLAVGGMNGSVDAERSVISGDGQVTSSSGRFPSDSTYTFGSHTWFAEASSVLRWTPTPAGYLFFEVGYRIAPDMGNWRVQMGDVPVELRSATWGTPPPTLRTRGAVVRVGFGAFAPTK